MKTARVITLYKKNSKLEPGTVTIDKYPFIIYSSFTVLLCESFWISELGIGTFLGTFLYLLSTFLS